MREQKIEEERKVGGEFGGRERDREKSNLRDGIIFLLISFMLSWTSEMKDEHTVNHIIVINR